jgi:hypothetical protein
MKPTIPRGPKPKRTQVTEQQEAILQQLIRRAKSPQSLVMRARIVLVAREYGRRNTEIGRDLKTSS